MIDTINQYENFVIYGAQVIAYGAYVAIKYLSNKTPECFVVSCVNDNPGEIEGIPVRTLDAVGKDTLVIIGVTELLQDEIKHVLAKNGYIHTVTLTQHEEHLLMSRYYSSVGTFPLLENKPGPAVDLMMYESHSRKDKALNSPPVLYPWETIIYADDYPKNLQYCEMSAVRWIWQNADADWIGIEHYRRHLLVAPELLSDDVDAVLPLPYICYPNEIAQFRRFISEDVLQVLLKALRILHPGQYDDYMKILNGHYQYTYNLLCAKREVFDQYCAWFFNITEYMETLAGEAPEIAETRALSYVAEVLTNLYFMSNEDNLKIRHTEKAIYT